MNSDAIGVFDRFWLDLRYFDRAQVHARLDPMLEKNVIETVARTHDDVGALDRLFGLRDRYDLNTQRVAHLPRKRHAIFGVGTETADGRDVPHRANRHELRAGLP